MILTCTQCQARFQIPEERIAALGSVVRCASCQSMYWLFRNGLMRPYEAGSPPPTLSAEQASAVSTPPPTTLPPAPLPPAITRSPLFNPAPVPPPLSRSSPPTTSPQPLPFAPSPLHLRDGDGLPNSEESWFDVPASLIQQKLQSPPPPDPPPLSLSPVSLGPKDSWLEIPLEEILSKSQASTQPAAPPPIPPNRTTKEKQDSWFEIPTTSAALSPNKRDLRDSWLEEDIVLPAHLREERIDTSQLPPSMHFPTSQPPPSMHFQTRSNADLRTVSSSSLSTVDPFATMPAHARPPQKPANNDGNTNILGLIDEEIPAPQLLDLDLEAHRKAESEEIFGEALQASLQTPLTPAPPPPAPYGGLARNNEVEFFLPDRIQQRQQFWHTLLPFITRTTSVLGLLVFFLWLWGSLLAGNFSQKQLAWARLRSLLAGEQHLWKIEQVHVHLYRRTKPFLVIRGTLHNLTNQPQRTPFLQLIQASHPSAPLSSNLPCCVRFQPSLLHHLHTPNQARSLYLTQLAQTNRRKIPAHGKKVFDLLWFPPPNLPDFRIRISLPQASRKP